MKKKMSLKVEDLEERIAPTITTPGLEGGVDGTGIAQGHAAMISGAALWGVFTVEFGDPGESDFGGAIRGNGNIGHFA